VNEDDSRKWNTVLANINNVQEELGRVDVRVVVIGPGLGMLKADALDGQSGAGRDGGRRAFCRLRQFDAGTALTKDDMIDGIAYAKAGYVELMRLQQQGWAYIRP